MVCSSKKACRGTAWIEICDLGVAVQVILSISDFVWCSIFSGVLWCTWSFGAKWPVTAKAADRRATSNKWQTRRVSEIASKCPSRIGYWV